MSVSNEVTYDLANDYRLGKLDPDILDMYRASIMDVDSDYLGMEDSK